MKITFVVAANAACFALFAQAMTTVKENDYYSKPCGWRMLDRDVTGEKEDYYGVLRGETNDRMRCGRRCGYTITDTAVIYVGSAGNMCWVRMMDEEHAEVGYWGARHGINLRRLLDDDQYDRLCQLTPDTYETQEPNWTWYDTLDQHPENPNHRSHWPEEAA